MRQSWVRAPSRTWPRRRSPASTCTKTRRASRTSAAKAEWVRAGGPDSHEKHSGFASLHWLLTPRPGPSSLSSQKCLGEKSTHPRIVWTGPQSVNQGSLTILSPPASKDKLEAMGHNRARGFLGCSRHKRRAFIELSRLNLLGWQNRSWIA